MIDSTATRAELRREQLVDLVHAGTSDPAGIAEVLGVSLPTVHRDLARLESEGRIIRGRGRALTVESARELSLQEREVTGRPQKIAIATHAAAHVHDGDVVILDAGSTVGELARQLSKGKRITAVTNGMSALNALLDARDVELIITGGRLRRISRGLVGQQAEDTIRAITGDRVFLGADGVSSQRGVCETSPEQAALKKLMIEQARDLYVLADSSKLETAPSNFWARLDRPWTLVTDSDATDEQLAGFRSLDECSVEVVDVAEPKLRSATP